MSSRSLPAFFAFGLLALSLAACGRAGPPQAPPRPGEAKQTTQTQGQKTVDDDETEPTTMSPIPTPQKQPKRPITVPDRPLLLDKIL